MRSPYLITGPAILSFSGGRTSGFMLKSILDAHGGRLPDDVRVGFANTGRECAETLDFVQECGSRWGVHITWLEYRFIPGEDGGQGTHTFEVVSHNSASRNGEPFLDVIRSRSMLPNPVGRFCTADMKVKTIERWAKRELGWKEWTNIVGLRADEPRRVANMRARNATGKDAWETALPLAEAKVTKRDVSAFWKAQPFDLRLPNVKGTTPEGNCDYCFLKGMKTLLGIMRRRGRPTWWIDAEAIGIGGEAAFFRNDRPSYAAMWKMVQDQGDLLDFAGIEDDTKPCGCHD